MTTSPAPSASVAPPRATRRWLVLAGAALAGGVAFAPRIGAQGSLPAVPVALQIEDIAERLHRAGFSDVTRLRRRGQVFTAEALSQHGMRARIVINGTTGEILGLRYVEDRAPQLPGAGS